MKTWNFDQIVSHAKQMQEKIDTLEAEVLKLKTPFDVMKKPYDISFSYYSHDVGMIGYSQKIKNKYEEALALAKENDIINAHNRDVVSKLKKTIIAAGFPETHIEWKRNKTISVTNDWTKDIIPVQGTSSAEIEKRYSEFLKLVEKHEAQQKANEERVRQEELAAIEEKKKEIAFIDLCRDLKMDPLTSSIDDLRENLASQCKYLRLAMAGEDTRLDWSDGAWRVNNALSNFQIVTNTDKEIYKEYSAILENFEDGRSFRDCEYNYDVLFSMVDPTLYGFYERLTGVKD